MKRVRGFVAAMTTLAFLAVLATPVAAAPSGERSGGLFAGLFQEIWVSLSNAAGGVWRGGTPLEKVEASSVSPPKWGGSQGGEPPGDGVSTETVSPPEWEGGGADVPPESP